MGQSASTVSTYITGLSHKHRLDGIEDNTKSFLVTEINKGFKRQNPPKRNFRTPISLSLPKWLIVLYRKVRSPSILSNFILLFYILYGYVLLDPRLCIGLSNVHFPDLEGLHLGLQNAGTIFRGTAKGECNGVTLMGLWKINFKNSTLRY